MYKGKRHGRCLILEMTVNRASTEHGQSITNFWSSIMDNYWAVRQHQAILTVLAAILGTKARDDITTTT
jgi:hypothetical protein